MYKLPLLPSGRTLPRSSGLKALLSSSHYTALEVFLLFWTRMTSWIPLHMGDVMAIGLCGMGELKGTGFPVGAHHYVFVGREWTAQLEVTQLAWSPPLFFESSKAGRGRVQGRQGGKQSPANSFGKR